MGPKASILANLPPFSNPQNKHWHTDTEIDITRSSPAGHGGAFRGEGMETIRKWSSYGRSLSPGQDFPSLGPGPFPVQSWGGGRSVQSIK